MPHDSLPLANICSENHDCYSILAGRADAGFVLLCDHASNALPPAYGTLGLPPEQLKRHIAYDIGGEAVTRALAEALGAPAILTRYSRLLIDPNRGIEDPTLIMLLSDGAIVPGNRRIDEAERKRRIELYYRPYHAAVDAVIDQCLATGLPTRLLSIHSFTESWGDRPRPWHVGVLYGDDQTLAKPLLEALFAEGDLIVGDNEPYAGQLEGDCLWQHGACRNIANVIIEIRQDLIREAAGQLAWAQRLSRIVDASLRPTLNEHATAAPLNSQVQPSQLAARQREIGS